MKHVRHAPLLAFALLAAACGGTPAASGPRAGTPGPSQPAGATATAAPIGGATVAPPAQGFDACALVTTAEVQAAIGSAVTAESGGAAIDGQTICTFKTADGEGVLYTSYDPDGKVGFDTWKASTDAQPLPGLGDEAIYEPTVGLMVRRGTATFQFYPLADISEEEALALATQLATLAATRF